MGSGAKNWRDIVRGLPDNPLYVFGLKRNRGKARWLGWPPGAWGFIVLLLALPALLDIDPVWLFVFNWMPAAQILVLNLLLAPVWFALIRDTLACCSGEEGASAITGIDDACAVSLLSRFEVLAASGLVLLKRTQPYLAASSLALGIWTGGTYDYLYSRVIFDWRDPDLLTPLVTSGFDCIQAYFRGCLAVTICFLLVACLADRSLSNRDRTVLAFNGALFQILSAGLGALLFQFEGSWQPNGFQLVPQLRSGSLAPLYCTLLAWIIAIGLINLGILLSRNSRVLRFSFAGLAPAGLVGLGLVLCLGSIPENSGAMVGVDRLITLYEALWPLCSLSIVTWQPLVWYPGYDAQDWTSWYFGNYYYWWRPWAGLGFQIIWLALLAREAPAAMQRSRRA